MAQTVHFPHTTLAVAVQGVTAYWPSPHVWHCVHTAGTPGNETAPLAEAVARSKALNAGRLYVTNETMPNPYAALPDGLYLEDLLRWAAGDFVRRN